MASVAPTSSLITPPGVGHGSAAIRRFTTVVKVPAAATGGAYSVLEQTLAPGFVAMPVHRHTRISRTLYVLEGAITVYLAGDIRPAVAGTTVHVPVDTPFTFWNARPAAPSERDGRGAGQPARVLVMTAPGGVEAYYAAVAAAISAAGTPDMPVILAASEAHGVVVDTLSLLDLVERYEVELS
jgi:mannose-6-phosphate isomerase-like protein (cupin superfamily)